MVSTIVDVTMMLKQKILCGLLVFFFFEIETVSNIDEFKINFY